MLAVVLGLVLDIVVRLWEFRPCRRVADLWTTRLFLEAHWKEHFAVDKIEKLIREVRALPQCKYK
jgi:hypothetical protein